MGNNCVLGPLLTLCRERPFDAVCLLTTPDALERAEACREAIQHQEKPIPCQVVEIATGQPLALQQELLRHLATLQSNPAFANADLAVNLSSSTVEQNAAWVALITSGLLLAKAYTVYPARYPGDEDMEIHELALFPGKTPPSRVKDPGSTYATRAPAEPESVDETLSREQVSRIARRIGIRGDDPQIQEAMDIAASVAQHAVPVLIQGETGTGKSLFAKLIHELSDRRKAPFVPVNCAALPEKLVESILFGHKKGAFTGATQDQPGKFERADGGTLFLDEIGELPLELQPKLLRALEDGIVEPLGASQGRKLDVRIVAATNRDLQLAIAEKTFREDLYYRLSFSLIALPPLRERPGDIHHLALHILDRLNRSLRSPKHLSPGAVARLRNQEWRGNVRDLENVIGRSLLLCNHETLEADDLVISKPSPSPDPYSGLPVPHAGFSLDEYMTSARKQLILKALHLTDGNQSAAAKLLGISSQAVHKFLKSLEP